MGSDNGGNLPEQASIEIHVCGSNRFYGSKMKQKIASVLTSRCFFPMKTGINTSVRLSLQKKSQANLEDHPS